MYTHIGMHPDLNSCINVVGTSWKHIGPQVNFIGGSRVYDLLIYFHKKLTEALNKSISSDPKGQLSIFTGDN
jgi:hypothetical protein